MFKNPFETKKMKHEMHKLHKNVRKTFKTEALHKAMRTGSRDEEGRLVKDADRDRND